MKLKQIPRDYKLLKLIKFWFADLWPAKFIKMRFTKSLANLLLARRCREDVRGEHWAAGVDLRSGLSPVSGPLRSESEKFLF